MSDDKNPAKRGLGRGLSLLIPGAPAPFATEHPTLRKQAPEDIQNDSLEGLKELPLNRIALNPYQPREHFDADELADLADSIREHGVLQPIVVRPKGKGWELIAGERRFRAATAARLSKIPALVRDFSDQEALEAALVENLQRENLNPIETARAYRRLQQEFSLSQTEVAKRVGKPQPTIANALRLLSLPDSIIESLITGQISEGHGKAILLLDQTADQVNLCREVIDKKLSVRDTERRAGAIKATAGVIPRGITPTQKSPEAHALEADLTLLLGAKTRIKPTSGERGVIEISYFDQEELEGIIDRLLRREA